jgi:hypothetical protein
MSSKKDCSFESTEPDDARLFKEEIPFVLVENVGPPTHWEERYFLDRM